MSLPEPRAETALDMPETLKLALGHHQAGERAAAERLYLKVLMDDPDEPTALYLYGLLNQEAGRPEIAERLLGRLVEVRPDNAEGHVALAGLACERGRTGEAIEGYRRALELQPGHALALVNLASILREQDFADAGGLDGAIELCRAAIPRLADPGPAYAVLGRVLQAAGRAQAAVEALRSAAVLAPADLALQAALALALVGAEDGEAALEVADAALVRDPAVHDAWLARGGALMVLHRPEAAAGAYERALALEPDRARSHLGLGAACAALDRNQEALQHLSRAVELDPASSVAHANLGALLSYCDAPEAAERHCRLALALDPGMAAAHQSLAGILIDRGEVEEGRLHRDTAYGLRNVVVVRAPQARACVLVLTTSDSGNVPHRHLLPPDRYSRIDWFIEYAREGQAAELPPYDVVFNIIGDPDYADATAAPVAAFLRQCERRVLNDPAKVDRTRRDRLPALLEGIPDAVVPKAVRLDAAALAADGLAACVAAAGLSAPVLIRPIGSHGGKGLTLAHDRADLDGFDLDGAAGVYVTDFVDFARPADGLYRKYRMIFVDRRPYPYHLAIADHWLVHYHSAGMRGDAARQDEERRFLEDPGAALGERGLAAMAAIGERMDLDYGGIDFSVLPDGRVLVFEANATMLVHPEAEAEFAYKAPHFEAITAAFQALVERLARQDGV